METRRRWPRACAAALAMMLCTYIADGQPVTTRPTSVDEVRDLLNIHPASSALKSFFDGRLRKDFAPSATTREDYLKLSSGIVEFWRHFQDERGAVVDPYEKLERQYSTPAFALAAATLVADAGRTELLEPATRALSWSLWCLANNKTADRHADFYIPMIIHARRLLHDRVPAKTLALWDDELRGIVPQKTYTATRPSGNWNLVQVSGEWMRRKDGLVAVDQLDPQRHYLEQCIATQLKSFTKLGMYVDPNAPLAYDAFPRLWLEDMLADGAYDAGEHRVEVEQALTLGGLSTLLLDSPSGEWPNGGRSAQHQWNEAQVAVICEINAARWKGAGRDDIAGAFRRVAHLSCQSIARWQRGSGELWIVKNFADPARRFGFMGYSFNSQYNLLTAAMLSMAYERADDSIAEAATPSEAGSYVFDVRDAFHHVAAASGGYYLWIDTGADLDYDATGLQRVHRAGVELSPLTGSSSPHTTAGPRDEETRLAMTPGIEWREPDGRRKSLADYGLHSTPPISKSASQPTSRPTSQPVTKPAMPERPVRDADLQVETAAPGHVAFRIQYDLGGGRQVEERYALSAKGVEGSMRVDGDGLFRFCFPALVNDGARDTDVHVEGAMLTITRHGAPAESSSGAKPENRKAGGTLVYRVTEPAGLLLERSGPQVVTQNGYVQAVTALLPPGVSEVRWTLTLAPEVMK